MKFLNKIFVVGLVFGFSITVNANFIDLNETDVNFEAIDFLREEGIIGGYPDGSFRPDGVLNRAELTKIVVESSDVDISFDESCFPDLEQGSWYARYVCTAFEMGVVSGYPDGNFRPAQNINRAEAVKIIIEAERLDLVDGESFTDVESGQWYEQYVDTAFELNYLPYVSTFGPGDEILRRNFSEIYFRAIKSRDSQSREYVEEVDLSDPYYPDTRVGGVLLSERIPKFVLVNEVYFFEGEVVSGNAQLSIENTSEDNSAFLGAAGSEFSTPIWFGSEGMYQLNMDGQIFEIQAIEDFDVRGLDDVSSFDFFVSSFANDVVLNQLGVSEYLKKYEFEFNEDNLILISRQAKDDLVIPNFWFNDLWSDEVESRVEVSLANFDLENSERSEFVLVETEDLPIVEGFEVIFNNIENERIDYTFGPGDSVDIRFDPIIPAEKYLYIIERSGQVVVKDDVVDIDEDGRVRMSYSPPNSSVYEIIEINDVDGRALVNYPVYRRNVLPIADDPYDTSGISLEASVENSLELLNRDRLEFGLQPLVLDESLANLAQFHASDMADNNYVSHADLNGRRVSDRKIDYGIKSFVGENIARNSELAAAQSSLMRSAAHRINILDPNWTEVGFGIAFDDNGLLYLVQNFSFDSDIAIDGIKDRISDRLGVEEDDDLVLLAESWTELMLQEQDFGTQLQGRALMTEVGELGKFVTGNAVTGISTFVSQIEDLLNDSLTRLEEEGYDFYAFDVRLGDDGILYFVLIVTS